MRATVTTKRRHFNSFFALAHRSAARGIMFLLFVRGLTCADVPLRNTIKINYWLHPAKNAEVNPANPSAACISKASE